MCSDKIVFVSMPRSGSTYMCKLAMQSLLTNGISCIKVNPEVSNIDQWKSNSQNIIQEHTELIKKLKLDKSKIDSNFVNRIFLHYLTASDSVILKYFPHDSFDFTVDELVAVAKKHRIRLIGLYRKNVLDMLISQIVKFNFGELVPANKNLVLSSKIQYNSSILNNDVVAVYKLYYDLFQKINSANMFETVIAYEELSFNSSIDSIVFNNLLPVDSVATLTEKSVSPDISAYVLSQLPFLTTDLANSLKDAAIPVTSDFCFLLGN